MPFDSALFHDSPKLERVDAVIDLLADRGKWCKGALGTADGRHSLLGAMQAVAAERTLARHIRRAIRELTRRRYWRIDRFNDASATTHDAIIEVLYRARHDILAADADAMLGWRRLARRLCRAPLARLSARRDRTAPPCREGAVAGRDREAR